MAPKKLIKIFNFSISIFIYKINIPKIPLSQKYKVVYKLCKFQLLLSKFESNWLMFKSLRNKARYKSI